MTPMWSGLGIGPRMFAKIQESKYVALPILPSLYVLTSIPRFAIMLLVFSPSPAGSLVTVRAPFVSLRRRRLTTSDNVQQTFIGCMATRSLV